MNFGMNIHWRPPNTYTLEFADISNNMVIVRTSELGAAI